VSDFARVTAVRRDPLRPGGYDAQLDLGWSIGGKPNGGYLMALLANAGLDAMHRPHALVASAHFLRPPDGGDAQLSVDVVKSGRTVSTARVSLAQQGRPCLDMLLTAGELPKEPPEHAGYPLPSMPRPEECRARSADDIPIELLDHVDVRLDPATVPAPPTVTDPVVRGWMRFRDGAEPDALSLLLAVDVCPPTVFHLGRLGWAPTVELTCLTRAEPAPGWLAFEARLTVLAGGWFDEEATVWDSTGRLVAQSRQLALAARA
jgi:acyl-CoA thioesterase